MLNSIIIIALLSAIISLVNVIITILILILVMRKPTYLSQPRSEIYEQRLSTKSSQPSTSFAPSDTRVPELDPSQIAPNIKKPPRPAGGFGAIKDNCNSE